MVLVGDSYQLAPVGARGGMFEQMCADLPWSQRLGEVWRMRNREERDASLALRSGHGNRLRKAVGWYRTRIDCTPATPSPWPATPLAAYHHDRAERKDSLLICDTWEMSDALNSRLHDDLYRRAGTHPRGQRDHVIRGRRHHHEPQQRLPRSRSNPAPRTAAARVSTRSATATDGASPGSDPKRNRSPPCASPTKRGRCSTATTYTNTSPWATRRPCTPSRASPSDRPTLILGCGAEATRAMAYVAMTRGAVESNDAYIYQRLHR